MFKKIKLIILSLACISQLSYANLLVTGDCNVSNATLTSVQISNLDISAGTGDSVPTSSNLLKNGPYNASECVGIYAGKDNVQTENNIGEFEDGFLNGEGSILTGSEFIDGLIDGNANLWYDGDPLDIDGDTVATDPGWINLGKFDVDNNSLEGDKEVISFDGTKSLMISDVLQFTFSCLGGSECSTINWTLTTDIDIAETVREVMGRSTFDHLAFVTKAGNIQPDKDGNLPRDKDGNFKKVDQGWAIYDFNFYEIFGKEKMKGNDVFDFETAYSLSGSIDIKGSGDFSAGLSHLSIWARDPLATVPEPSTLAIFALGMIGLASRRFKKQS
jgi:hypothetical protein